MGRHALLCSFSVATMAFTALTTAVQPACAEISITASTTADTALSTARRDYVRRVATSPYVAAELREEALHALLSHRGDVAIDEFIATGSTGARERAALREEYNRIYIQEINRYALRGSAVEVTSARALVASANAQDEYVHSGYAEAVAADERTDNQHQEHLARLAREDREYVAFLAENDPGEQVRAAARRALERGDTEIALFFKYYWGLGADLDNESFRRRTLQQNEIWHRRIRVLTEAALAAERAEREASGELARKARLDAIAHWEAIEDEADQSSVDWNAAKGSADAQAAAWARIAEYARSAQSEQDWAAVLDRATRSNTSWADEAEWARQQAKFWQDLASEARTSADAARDRGDD